MQFIGIDYGWQSGPSGLCCLTWDQEQLRLRALDRRCDPADLPNDNSKILDWVDGWVGPEAPALVAVDAPTIIPNPTGMRLADRLTHRYFHRYHAGAYPANLGRPFAAKTVALGLSLEARGFVHAPLLQPRQLGRYQIEVFPHPAIVHLFGLQQILKYKRGKVAERRRELRRLYRYILDILPNLKPALALKAEAIKFCGLGRTGVPASIVPADFEGLKGTELQGIEDQLDALICAYVGAHWWYWGFERNWVLGDQATGYIVVPAPYSWSDAEGNPSALMT